MAAAPGKKKPPPPPKPPLVHLTGQGDFSQERSCSNPHQGQERVSVAEKQIQLLKTKTEDLSTRKTHESVIKNSSERPTNKPPLFPKPQTPLKPVLNLSKYPNKKSNFSKPPNLIIPLEKCEKFQHSSPISKHQVKAPVAKLEEFYSVCDGPVRPPRSPKTQPFKGDPFKAFEEKPELPLKKKQLSFIKPRDLQSDWQTTKEKTASLGRTNAFRYVDVKSKAASLGRNVNLEFASYITNESDLQSKNTPIPPPRQKKKSSERPHTFPEYAQVNYSMKKNRRAAACEVEENLDVVEGKLVLPGVRYGQDDETETPNISPVHVIQNLSTDTEEIIHTNTADFPPNNSENAASTDSVQISQPATDNNILTVDELPQIIVKSQQENEHKANICKDHKLEMSDNLVNGTVISEDKTISVSVDMRVDNVECSLHSSSDSRRSEESVKSVVKCDTEKIGISNQQAVKDVNIQSNNSELYRIVKSRSKSYDNCDVEASVKNLVDLVSVKVNQNIDSQGELQESVSLDINKEESSTEKYDEDNVSLIKINQDVRTQEPSNQESHNQIFNDKRSGNENICELSVTEQLDSPLAVNKDSRLSTSSLPISRNFNMKESGKLHRRRQSWGSYKDDSSSLEKAHHKHKSRTYSLWCDDGDLSSGTLGDLDSSDNAARQSSLEEGDWNCSDVEEESGHLRSKLSCWLGSFGKGNRKQRTKRDHKSNSQFYCDSQDTNLENKQSSTLQIPQNCEIVTDSFDQDVDSSRPASGLSTLSALDIDDRTDTCESIQSFEIYQQSESENESEQNADCGNENLSQSEESRLNKKAFYIAQEIMTSERVFIDVLKLLNLDFRNAVKAVIPIEALDKILVSLPQLQHLNEDLLRDLEYRIENWCSIRKISDVIVKKGPFLKLYTSYIKNFEFQCNYLEECCQKYPKFAKVLKEFEASPRCQKLSLRHYMLKPVQRIPQYRLLLEDYLRNLSSSSPDLEDTKAALRIVCDVADHANKSIKLGDHLSKLLQLQSQLGNYEIIKPGRVFLKEGELFKLSRKGMQPRYFILLNDCLLYTSYNGAVQSSGLKVNYELPLSSMKVNTPQAEDYRNEFSIISVRRSFTLCARSLQERQDWVDALQKAITDNISRQKTFHDMKLSCSENEKSAEPFKLGQQAPVWIQDRRVTMCQSCTAEFTVTFRRHHCRACGKVVCGDCSNFRAPLEYMQFQSARICEDCHDTLLKEAQDPSSEVYQALKRKYGNTVNLKDIFKRLGPSSGKKIKKFIPQRFMEVTANDAGSEMSGWLHRRSRRSWKRFWFVLKKKVLYVYKASEDIVALDTLAVLGYSVEQMKNKHFQLYEGVDAKLVFQLTHNGQQPHIFHAESEHLANRWIAAMREATILEE